MLGLRGTQPPPLMTGVYLYRQGNEEPQHSLIIPPPPPERDSGEWCIGCSLELREMGHLRTRTCERAGQGPSNAGWTCPQGLAGMSEVAEPSHIGTPSEPELPLFPLVPQADAQSEWQAIPQSAGAAEEVRHTQPLSVLGPENTGPREWPRVLPFPLKWCLTDFLSQLLINQEPQLQIHPFMCSVINNRVPLSISPV